MRPIVIDTSWLLPAFLSRSEKPWSRNLLILTALGGLTLRRRTIEEEWSVLRREGERLGVDVYDAPFLGKLDALERRRDEMRDRLGMRAPDDLCLVGSRLLFDELERKVREVGARFDPRLSDDTPERVRRQVERLTAIVVGFDPREQLRAWTTDPDDDYVIETAFRADAAAIIAMDAHLVPRGPRMQWVDESRGISVPAYWLSAFIEDEVNNSGFDIDDVDPGLLELAMSPLD
jgi:predicted nucleic acid-binding protein